MGNTSSMRTLQCFSSALRRLPDKYVERRVFATPKSIVYIVKSGASPGLDVLNRFNQLYARQQTTAVNWIEARSSGFTRPNRAKLSACISGSWHNALPPFWWLPCPTCLIADMDHGNLGRS